MPSKLGDSHPEWFPEIDGKRKVPHDDNDHRWQPCLANPEAAHYAAGVASEYFDKNPTTREPHSVRTIGGSADAALDSAPLASSSATW